jgi:hypothetical protein
MPSAGVDPAMSQIKRLEICPLGCMATRIGSMAVPSWRNQANSGDVNDLKEQQDEKHIMFASSLFQTNGFIAKKHPFPQMLCVYESYVLSVITFVSSSVSAVFL